MIILDTNVVSEMFKPTIAPAVAAWIASQRTHELFLCAPVIAELRYGVVKLPPGRKRDELAERYERLRLEFRSRVFGFDLKAAEAFADIIAARAAAGAPIQTMDAQIAAIGRSRGASVATRNLKDFEGCGVPLIDPWA